MPLRCFTRRGSLLLLASTLMLAVGLLDVHAQAVGSSASAYSADAVRSAYLVNFARFAEWPAGDKDAPFTIGVVGNRALEDRLISITEGKTIQGGRNIRVRRLTSPADARQCELVYIHPAFRTETSPFTTIDWLHAVQGAPILTVGEEEGFLQKGGMINFYAANNNLRFEIAPQAAEAAGLQLSSRLLAIARIVNVPGGAKQPSEAP